MILVGRLFSLFFMGVGVMILVSGTVISYATIFGSGEIPFMLVRPFSISQIVISRFIEATAFSSWAFFFVIIPFTGSYAYHRHLSPMFAVWTLLYSIPFLFLLSGIGTLLVMAVVRWFPRGPTVRRVGLLLLLAAAISGWIYSGRVVSPMVSQQFNITQLIPGLRAASYPLNPAWWVAEGIMALSRGDLVRGGIFFMALLSCAALVVMLIEWLGCRTFYTAWQRTLTSERTIRKPVLLAWMDPLFHAVPHDIGAVMLKDIRTFFRDTAQWSQALVFFGLLAFYFANLRTFNYNTLPDEWRSAIAFLNVFAVSAVISSLGARFVYPQLSLEGHGFWLLGLSPANKSRIMAAKFILALVSLTAVSVVLVWLSGSMLATSPAIRLSAVAVIACISLAVCALSTGLGAVFLDLRQSNPAAIVSGFGGTLNLVACLTFMLVSIFPFGIIFHLQNSGKLLPAQFVSAMRLAALWLAVITATAVIVPLRLGLRSLQNRDY
jgi:ABC-2 type transport system permease protein